MSQNVNSQLLAGLQNELAARLVTCDGKNAYREFDAITLVLTYVSMFPSTGSGDSLTDGGKSAHTATA